jgi:dTDP-4-amino-4,6-dideoxygalactose transaminase
VAEYRIPFNRPSFVGRETEYAARALEDGHISGDGQFTRDCNKLLEDSLGAAKVLLTTSCTHALELAALLLDIKAGDEVILPAFTFVSTANAFVLRGAKPVFADIRPDTLNIDHDQLPDLVTERTRAIVVVHYAGVGCEMDSITPVAEAAGAAVVEDNAHGLFGTYKGRILGSFGRISTLSFHETKNFTCGEGGALVLNEDRDVERAEILREKGTNRSRFFRGQVDKYTWVDVGSSYLPSDLLAAILYAQLEQRDLVQERRRRVWERYHSGLAAWAGENGVTLPTPPSYCEHPSHMFQILLPTPEARTWLIDHLLRQGILAVFHYLPLHLSPMGERFGGKPGDCPVTEDVSARLLRLPMFSELGVADQDQVMATVMEFSAT